MITILGKGFISCLISINIRNLQLLSCQKIYTLLGVLWNVRPWSSDYARLWFGVHWYLKKGRNNKSIIYMTIQWYIPQDSYIHLKTHIYTARLVYLPQDSYIYVTICVYTSRFVSLNIKKHSICTGILEFVYVHYDLCIFTRIREYNEDLKILFFIFIKIRAVRT